MIDFHAHIALDKCYPARFLDGLVHDLTHSPPTGADSPPSPARLNRFLRGYLKDASCDLMVHRMNEARIDTTVVHLIDAGIDHEDSRYRIEEVYAAHAAALRAFPDRLVVFAGVDPRRGKSGFELFKRGILEYGFRGVKLYPPMGYSLDHPDLVPYLHYCAERCLPVLIHTSASLKFLDNSRASVAGMISSLKRHPKICFILAHAGYALANPSVREALRLPNVHADIAGFPAYLRSDDTTPLQTLGAIFHDEWNEKILFGSDWPLFNLVHPLKRDIESIHTLFDEHFSDKPRAYLENILFRNAARILGLR